MPKGRNQTVNDIATRLLVRAAACCNGIKDRELRAIGAAAQTPASDANTITGHNGGASTWP